MNFDLSYTLRMALETYVPELTKAHIMRDGFKVDGLEKPFGTVEYLQGSTEILSAGRTSYGDTFHFQIGIFARTINERHSLETKLRTILRRPDGVPFYVYDVVSGQFTRTEERALLTEEGFTPISNGDSTQETANHHGYFDVSIEVLRSMGEQEFTQ